MVRAIVSDINDWYRDAANTQLHYALKIGGHLIKLKAEAKEAGQKWGDICERLPFSQSTAVKLMSIAGNTALENSEFGTCYEFAERLGKHCNPSSTAGPQAESRTQKRQHRAGHEPGADQRGGEQAHSEQEEKGQHRTRDPTQGRTQRQAR